MDKGQRWCASEVCAGVRSGHTFRTSVLSALPGSLRLPFMLAFWAGYGIEAVFRLLDRLSRALGDVAKTA